MSATVSNNLIQTELLDGVFIVKINSCENRSSLSIGMCGNLTTVLEQADRDSAVKVVLLRGCDDFFTAGSDVADFVNFPLLSLLPPARRFLDVISRTGKPIVAAVNGGAAWVGTIMMLRCDLVYAADTVIFQMPFVSLGVCTEAGTTLPLLLGHQNASELLLLCEPSTAARAEHIGFVTAVVPYARFLKTGRPKASSEVQLSPPAYLPTMHIEEGGVYIQGAA